MEYKFRLCFQFPNGCTFTGNQEFVEFDNGSGLIFKLAALENDKKLDKCSRFHLIGGPYKTIEDALDGANATKVSLLYYSACQRVGIDLGKYALSGGLTNAGKEMFEEKYGAPVLNDQLGITIFESEPSPLFVKLSADGIIGKSTDGFVQSMKESLGKYSFSSAKSELAAELFTMSYFETTSSARFLSLFMSLEALMEPSPKSDESRRYVEELINLTKDKDLPNKEKDSLLGSLAWLKNESIAQTGKKMANTLLSGKEYATLNPDLFFAKIYGIRNNLVHRGVVDREELHIIAREFDRFVSDILRTHFIVKATQGDCCGY